MSSVFLPVNVKNDVIIIGCYGTIKDCIGVVVIVPNDVYGEEKRACENQPNEWYIPTLLSTKSAKRIPANTI